MYEVQSEFNCHIAFEICEQRAFERLVSVFEEFKRQKDSTENSDEEHWLTYFEESDRTTFWWPDQTEAEMWNEFWFSTPLPKRLSSSMPTPSWHFGSMVDAILEGDYDLVEIRKLDHNQGRLEINPHGYPFGGMSSLRALVRAFGHRIEGYDDGTGFVKGDELGVRWTPSMKPQKF